VEQVRYMADMNRVYEVVEYEGYQSVISDDVPDTLTPIRRTISGLEVRQEGGDLEESKVTTWDEEAFDSIVEGAIIQKIAQL
jgi:hypothetical protein